MNKIHKTLKNCSDDTKQWYKENCRSWLNQYSVENGISFAMAQRLILYLVDERLKTFDSKEDVIKFLELRKSFSGDSLEKYIKLYGDDLGTLLYNKSCKSKSDGMSLNSFIERHGIDEGTKRWNELLSSRKIAMSNSINYENWKKSLSNAGKLEGFIKRYGVEKGIVKYNKMCERKSKSTSKDFLIEKYGIDWWNDYINKRISRSSQSKSEKNFFDKLEILINSPIKRQHKIDQYFYDGFIDNCIIEYNGSPWHGNPLLYEFDDKPNHFKQHMSTIDIWEYDKKKCDVAIKSGISRIFYVWDTDDINEKMMEIYEYIMKKSTS